MREEYAYYITKKMGYKGMDKYILIGKDYFTPIEVMIKSEVNPKEIKAGDLFYLGEGKRDIVRSIIGRAKGEDFENVDPMFVLKIIEKIIKEKEEKFIGFFNTAGAFSVKRHILSLIPGVGNKVLAFLLRERQRKKFESFKDLEERLEKNKVALLPVNSLAKRIFLEIKDEDKNKIFVK